MCAPACVRPCSNGSSELGTKLAEKPPDTEPALVLSLVDLLNDAQQRIRSDMPGTDYLLFNTGDPDYPFVLMLLAEARTLEDVDDKY